MNEEHRTNSGALVDLLSCAERVEQELRLPNETLWFLSSDSTAVYEAAVVQELKKRRKLVHFDERIFHVDGVNANAPTRVSLQQIEGALDGYVSHYMISRASAVVMGESSFSLTAAQIGASPFVFFHGNGSCLRVDMSAL